MRRSGLLLFVLAAGCASQPRAQNPFPGVFRVAVVPFGDKTNGAEGLDTALITEQFASELQMVPTFEVVPVQEVVEVLGGTRIDGNQPEAAFAIARAVHAQAVVIGSVTEYDPYYPPMLGLHCEMYAMVTGEPELVVQTILARPDPPDRPPGAYSDYVPRALRNWVPPALRTLVPQQPCKACPPDEANPEPKPKPESSCLEKLARWVPKRRSRPRRDHDDEQAPTESPTTDAESVASGPGRLEVWEFAPGSMPIEGVSAELAFVDLRPVDSGTRKPASQRPSTEKAPSWRSAAGIANAQSQAPAAPRERRDKPNAQAAQPDSDAAAEAATDEEEIRLVQADATVEDVLEGRVPEYQLSTVRLPNPAPIVEPWVIRHSRIFDGSNLGLAYKLQDYFFFKKDLRGGEWVGYAERSRDFSRFACNRMIYEMLESAGGRWFTMRGVRFPKPWKPWPWR